MYVYLRLLLKERAYAPSYSTRRGRLLKPFLRRVTAARLLQPLRQGDKAQARLLEQLLRLDNTGDLDDVTTSEQEQQRQP